MRIISFLALFLAASPAHAAPFTLRDLVTHALGHSPVFNSAEREALIAEMERKNSGAAFLPSLDLTAAHGWERTRPQATDNPWTSSFSLALTENLYDNGQSITRYRTAKLGEERARIQLLQARDRLLLQVANEYFNFALASRSLETQKQQHALLKKQADLVESGYRQGIKTRKDYLRFRAQLSQADINLLNAENSLAQSAQELKKLVGMEAPAPLELALDESKPAKAELGPIALETHREIRIAELQTEASRLQEAQVKRRLWPELSLTAGGTYGSNTYLGTNQGVSEAFRANDRVTWNALLTLKYNFLDWGTRSREGRIAAERTAIQENAGLTRRLELRQELDRLNLSLDQLQRSFRLGQELLELEERGFELISAEYRQGKVTYLDYINALEKLASAKNGYYSSLFNLKKSLLSQKFHQGTLYESILAQ